jgi:secreted trypsin-like serine protease
MRIVRKLSLTLAVLGASIALAAPPSGAVVGGGPASPGEYPAVARIVYGPFLCTGTLIAPDTVLSAGHCSSVTGAAIATPASWPPQAIDVRIGGQRRGEGEQVPVQSVVMHENYLATMGYDISLLKLASPSSKVPVKVAGAAETGIWSPGALETIVGWGATEEDGSPPDVLQEAQVPVTTDQYCSDAYDGDFESQTMVCAGFPEGGVDTCQGDSGGPMFGRAPSGELRVVGTTSWGEGCARPGKPGVYGRVGDTTLREWIRSRAPNGVN